MAQEEKFDAYVFMHLVELQTSLRGVVEDVGTLIQAREDGFVAQFVGSYAAFARFEVGSLGDLQTLIADPLWKAGVRSEWSTAVAKSHINTPKRGSPDYCALVRVRAAKDPFELLDELDDRFGPLVDPDTYFYGAAVINGKYDLLVDLGRPAFDLLKRALVEDLLSVSGIASTETSFAYLPGNAIGPSGKYGA